MQYFWYVTVSDEAISQKFLHSNLVYVEARPIIDILYIGDQKGATKCDILSCGVIPGESRTQSWSCSVKEKMV